VEDPDQRRATSRALTKHDVPNANDPWEQIETFALSFDGYERRGSFERCAEIANRWAETFPTAGELPNDQDELRTCLFFEQRRWRHFGHEPDAATQRYIAAVLAKIRDLVSDRPTQQEGPRIAPRHQKRSPG
jgi:hypothetical protein